MPVPETAGMRNQNGFTLIEATIVIVIMDGLVLGNPGHQLRRSELVLNPRQDRR